jgi:RNA polymerase-interacting CarD/CdnL/TRCF family regulator
MPQTSVPFKVGDHVVYPSQGAGKIIGMVERPVQGVAQSFFEIELMKGSMSVLVPVAQAERVGLRRITVAKLIPELLEGLHLPDLELPRKSAVCHRTQNHGRRKAHGHHRNCHEPRDQFGRSRQKDQRRP